MQGSQGFIDLLRCQREMCPNRRINKAAAVALAALIRLVLRVSSPKRHLAIQFYLRVRPATNATLHYWRSCAAAAHCSISQ